MLQLCITGRGVKNVSYHAQAYEKVRIKPQQASSIISGKTKNVIYKI
jgi:hypothetical protein